MSVSLCVQVAVVRSNCHAGGAGEVWSLSSFFQQEARCYFFRNGLGSDWRSWSKGTDLGRAREYLYSIYPCVCVGSLSYQSRHFATLFFFVLGGGCNKYRLLNHVCVELLVGPSDSLEWGDRYTK